MNTDLREMIDAFFAERSESEGGMYAPVGEDDIRDLYAIIYKILETKYDLDMDGDLPINVRLIDRTRFEYDAYTLVPHRDDDPMGWASSTLINLKIATFHTVNLEFILREEAKRVNKS